MKRFAMTSIVLATITLAGCAGGGDYAFFRNPDEQRAINQAYTRDVAAKQGVGETTGSGSGEVRY